MGWRTQVVLRSGVAVVECGRRRVLAGGPGGPYPVRRVGRRFGAVAAMGMSEGGHGGAPWLPGLVGGGAQGSHGPVSGSEGFY
ncbi:hypothetical protein GCM10009760_13250 [Kitasatospora kazusensis]|uniref:Uncharacterized protein n=1 Tax=Kitasatospora kazusensis TaxID=407974 RepID=A0ABN2Z0Z0_9ACTN